MRIHVLVTAVLLLFAVSASAEIGDGTTINLWPARAAHDPWQVSWLPPPPATSPSTPARSLMPLPALSQQSSETQPLHATAVEYSDAYQTRRKIHKYASFATLPLFAAEVAMGQAMYNNDPNTSSGAMGAAHAAVGVGIVGLFGVNTVTGAWNLFGEGWSDEHGRTLRLIHGLLMMTADAGFVATSLTGPKSGGRRGALTFDTDKVTHRNIAIASVSVATVGYLIMLIGNH